MNEIEFKYKADKDFSSIPFAKIELSDGTIHYLSEKNPSITIPPGLTATIICYSALEMMANWDQAIFAVKEINELK